jgi:hypothetical protein
MVSDFGGGKSKDLFGPMPEGREALMVGLRRHTDVQTFTRRQDLVEEQIRFAG